MMLAREETFGPVAPLFRFTTDEEAIRLANDTEFGLAAYFYGRDVARVWRVAEGARIRDRRHQYRADLHRGGPLRRDEGIGPGPRGIEVRDRGITSRSSTCASAASGTIKIETMARSRWKWAGAGLLLATTCRRPAATPSSRRRRRTAGAAAGTRTAAGLPHRHQLRPRRRHRHRQQDRPAGHAI